MTLWDVYLLFLHKIGLGPKPGGLGQIELTLTLPKVSPTLKWRRFNFWEWVGLPSALGCAFIGEIMLARAPEPSLLGIALLASGAGLFVLAVWRSALTMPAGAIAVVQPPLIAPASTPRTLAERWPLLLAALTFSAVTFLLAGDNNMPTLGFLTWGASVLAWLLLFWETEATSGELLWRKDFTLRPLQKWLRERRLKLELLWRQGLEFKFTATAFFFLMILLVAVYFRFYKLNEVPVEMTSDHIEKLLDANEILNLGRRPIFEPTNGGRESLAFYLVAWVGSYNGLNHLTLKIVMSVAGLLALPFIFLLARELFEDEMLALLTLLLASVSWWANTISRNGLRFPFAVLFGAIALWLMIAAIKRSRRNLALLAGLLLGIGLYGYTAIRVVIIAFALVLGVHALHQWRRQAWVTAAQWWVVAMVVASAVYVPTFRYAFDDPYTFLLRSTTRMFGDPSPEVPPPPPLWPTLASNELNSLGMFFRTADGAWLVSPVGQPALDWVMGACFLLGVAYLIYHYVRWRDWRDLFVLLAVPILLLPSTLALALPGENPSLHRSAVAITVVFLIAALPLRLLFVYGRKLLNDWRGTALASVIVGSLVLLAAQENWRIVFVTYAQQYKDSVQNASELGGVVRAWATTVGNWDTVTVKAYPYWVDTRAVGIYAGKFGWDNVIIGDAPLVPKSWQGDARPKLYIVNRHDTTTIAALRAAYPTGVLTYQKSDFHDKDYLTFFVPGTADFDEKTLPPTP